MKSNVNITVSERHGRTYASTGSSWEPVIGYSRAVRTGDVISVTGTVGVGADGQFAPTLKAQAERALEIIVAAIEALGGKVTDVVRTRIYVTNIDDWKEIGEVHGKIFADVRPATTMVEVPRLIDAAALVEIEADAIVVK